MTTNYRPINPGFTRKKAFQKFLFMLLVLPVGCLIISYAKSGFDLEKVNFKVVMLGTAMAFSFSIFNVFLTRYPIRVEISELSETFDITYLNGFGREKDEIINIKGSQIKYVLKSNKNPSAGKQFRIIQNLFNNWIHIDESHGYTAQQINEIYNKAIEIKNNIKFSL